MRKVNESLFLQSTLKYIPVVISRRRGRSASMKVDEYCLHTIGMAFIVRCTKYGGVWILENYKLLHAMEIQSELQIFCLI